MCVRPESSASSWQKGKHISRFVSEQEADFFHYLISALFTFHLYHLYVFNALSVKNVERLITVWWSKA